MFPIRYRNAVVDTLFGSLSVIGGVLVIGYAVNSQTAHDIRRVPIIGPLLDPLATAMRRAVNKVYDQATED